MLGALEAIAARAGQYLLESFRARRGLDVVVDKGDDVTREVDLALEEMVYKMLRDNFREGGVLYAEERGFYRWGDERYIFVLDPLDGSYNYAVGIPMFIASNHLLSDLYIGHKRPYVPLYQSRRRLNDFPPHHKLSRHLWVYGGNH